MSKLRKPVVVHCYWLLARVKCRCWDCQNKEPSILDNSVHVQNNITASMDDRNGDTTALGTLFLQVLS